ncbi:Uncharacterised protein g3021 [Pycnogonum litorale]
MKSTCFLVLIAATLGLTSATGGRCSCFVRLFDEDGNWFNKIQYQEDLTDLSDCESPSAKVECENECNQRLHHFNVKSVWTKIKPTIEGMDYFGDQVCNGLKINFENIIFKNFYTLCENEKWLPGNVTSERLSCKDGKMVK